MSEEHWPNILPSQILRISTDCILCNYPAEPVEIASNVKGKSFDINSEGPSQRREDRLLRGFCSHLSHIKSHTKLPEGTFEPERPIYREEVSGRHHLSAPGGTRRHKSPFEGDTLGGTLTSNLLLTVHGRIHSDERPFMLPGRPSAARQRIHSDESPLMCTTCLKVLPSKSKLQEHERVHTGERPFECTTCGKTYKRRTHLRDHLFSHMPVANLQ